MGTTNNWVKDGLDAYLAVTGEKRAQDKAKDDKAFQQQSMQLLQDQNQRADAAAGLTSQTTQLAIDKGKREAEDDAKWDEWDGKLFNTAVAKETANPHTPTIESIKDPAIVEMSKYVYGNNLKTVAFARDAVAKSGNMSIPMDKLPLLAPQYVQDTVKHVFGPAAAKRAGQEAVDPVTQKTGIITGNMGHVNLLKGEDGEVYLSADMEIKDQDGSIRYAPFTNRTDDPSQPVKMVPLKALEHEANATIQGIDDALQAGADPATTITSRKLVGLKEAPRKVKEEMYKAMQKEDENLRTMESDVATTKKVGKVLESMQPQINALPWKDDPHTAVVNLYTTLSQSGMTTAEVEKAVTRITSAKVPTAKNLQIEEIGTGGDMVQKAIVGTDGKTTPIGKPYRKHAAPSTGGSDKELLLVKRDVSTRLREAQRGYQAAVKKGNPDAIADAVDYIEQLNGDAKTYGVSPLPVPKRPMTSDEESSLYEQATKAAREKQGKVARAMGLDPNKDDVEAEFQRLKQAKPRAKRPHGADLSPSDTVHTHPSKQQSAPQKQATPQNQGTLNGAPPAAQHSGRIIRDTATGKRFKSNGASWLEVR